ncbi:HEPN domain-containing protein [bacterium]|nr:MAG: HEPN domain-containing protein [bacterium]
MARRGDIRPWVYKAEEDYRAALTLARKRRDPVPDNVCFSAQQCAEKYLKAFLVYHRKRFPKTHDLLELLKLGVSVDPLLDVIRPDIRELLPYAVAFRYPGEEATGEEAQRAVRAMKKVRDIIRERLGLP